MKTKFILLFLLSVGTSLVSAQFLNKLKNAAQKSAERAVERKVEEKSRKTTEKAVDQVLNPEAGTSTNSKSNKKNKLEEDSGAGLSESDNKVGFKRGNKILFQDNFEKDALGDFPARWNSTAGGEVKNLKNLGRFLRIQSGGVVYPELKSLPENFTLEYDLIYPSDHPYRRMAIGFGSRTTKIDNILSVKDVLEFNIMSADFGNTKYHELWYSDRSLGDAKTKISYKAPLDKVIKIAFEVNGKRIRMFIDGKKMVDLPSIFRQEYRKYIFFNSIQSGWKETDDAYFYIGNFVLAETGKDERSSVLKDLIDKGSFSTNAILFASGSDKIQSESASVLEEIKNALVQAPDIKVKIVGHTDNTGKEKVNLTLSKKRADAVKSRLVSMGISNERLQTDGKGQSEPISSNSTEDGKAQNRRVELIKL